MPEPLTPDSMQALFEKCKNWGRWGAEDECGALNFIQGHHRKAAAALVQDGHAVSCSREFPVEPAPHNPHPAQHMMVAAGDAATTMLADLEATLDYIGIACHGMATSHIDALCHVSAQGTLYNGVPVTDVKSTGATRNSIMAARDGIVGRGVLLDMPRLRGTEAIEPDQPVTPDELDAACKSQGVEVGEGDILLVAIGRDAYTARYAGWSPADGLGGLHAECAPWLHDRCIAVLGGDGVSDNMPGEGTAGWAMPMHQCCLTAMGIHLLDNLELRRLQADCAERGRWEFLFTVEPLRVERGTGCAINPIALL